MSAICSDCICVWCRKHETCNFCKECTKYDNGKEKWECPYGGYEDREFEYHWNDANIC